VNLTLRETILLKEPLDVTRFITALDVSLSRINLTGLIREGSSFLLKDVKSQVHERVEKRSALIIVAAPKFLDCR